VILHQKKELPREDEGQDVEVLKFLQALTRERMGVGGK